MIIHKLLVTTIIMLIITVVSGQDDADATPKVGDVANSNPFDSAVNHDLNDSQIEDHALFTNVTSASGMWAAMATVKTSSTTSLNDFTTTTVPPVPSMSKHAPSSVSANVKSASRRVVSHQFKLYFAVLTITVVLRL